MASIEILSNRAQELVDSPQFAHLSSIEGDSTFKFPWPSSEAHLNFQVSTTNIISAFSYENASGSALIAFLEAFGRICINKELDVAKSLSSREVDFFLRDTKSVSALSDPLILELWTKYAKKMVKEISKGLLKNTNTCGYTYDEEKFGTFFDLSHQCKLEEVGKAINAYSISFFTQNNPVEIELIDVDELVVVVKIEKFNDTEHILENLRVFLNDVFNEKEFNTITDF